MTSLMNTYKRLPVGFAYGKGVWLYDTQDRAYLDAVSGIAVCGLGHAHPKISQAICSQAQKLLHTSNLYEIPLQETLGARLNDLAGMERVFFANSGAEANEAAIKLARLHGHKQGIEQPVILVMENSFHGRTLATLSATGNRKVQAGFEPLVQGFARVPYDDLEAVRNAAAHLKHITAILVEPIQGEGGVRIPSPDYLPGLRDICDQHGWLLMLDEVQTGMGRTGRPFAFQHSTIQPDVVTLAKALGNGMPIGACLAQGSAAELFAPGHHGSTFGGNPLACAAALAVLEVMEQGPLWQQAATQGQQLLEQLQAGLSGLNGVVDIRGQGLMLGIELDRPCTELVSQALEQGLLINVTAETVIRLLPPLIISVEETTQLANRVIQLIADFLEKNA